MRRQVDQVSPLILRFSMLLLLAGLLVRPAWAGSGIHCFVDNKGVTNCTNIPAHKPTSSRPQSIASVKKSALTATEPASQSISEPLAVRAVSAPAAPLGQSRTTYVYRYQKSKGVTLFTDVPDRSLTLVSTAVYQSFDKGWTGSLFKTSNWKLNREAYNDTILSMANEKAVDPDLVRAVIHAESNFNPMAVSRTGAMGLMQLMPGTAERFGVGNAFDPQANIRGGVTYLRFLLDKFNGDERLAVAGYNAGEGAVTKYGGVPPYNETTNYVARVMDLHGQYRAEQ